MKLASGVRTITEGDQSLMESDFGRGVVSGNDVKRYLGEERSLHTSSTTNSLNLSSHSIPFPGVVDVAASFSHDAPCKFNTNSSPLLTRALAIAFALDPWK